MMTEKEKIWDEIKILQKHRSEINMELALLWDKYYALNKKEKE